MYSYVCMSGILLTGEKKIRDTMASLLLSERAPSTRACILSLLPWWSGGALLQRMLQRGNSPGDSPTLNRDPALSAKVTTGGLSAPASRWKAKCHLLWIDGFWPPVHAPLLGIDVEEPCGSHCGRKNKRSFSG
jgi:hypothetical protein